MTQNKKQLSWFLVTGCLVFALAIVAQPAMSFAAEQPDILVGSDMTVGSTGPGVAMLQALLSEIGYLQVPFGVPLGYFGPLTKDAVARYQRDMSVSPTAGYFGPKTKIAMHEQFSTHGWLSLLGW